jgi:hypothetical protein
MLMKKCIAGFLALVVLVLGSGCGNKSPRKHTHAHHRRSAKVVAKKVEFHGVKDNVEVNVRTLDKHDCKKTFGRDLDACGYQALQLTLFNNSKNTLLLRASDIRLPIERVTTVTENSRFGTMFYSLPSACIAALFFWPALLPMAGIGAWMSHKNHRLVKTLYAMGFDNKDTVELLPFESVSRMVFVANDALPNKFLMRVYNINQKSFIPFAVTV